MKLQSKSYLQYEMAKKGIEAPDYKETNAFNNKLKRLWYFLNITVTPNEFLNELSSFIIDGLPLNEFGKLMIIYASLTYFVNINSVYSNKVSL